MALDDLDPDALYHLATADEWADYQLDGSIVPPSLNSEGFVHCSWGHQVEGTVARHFSGATDLLALRVDPNSLPGVVLVEEDSHGSGQTFPHVYGPIPALAVVSATPVV